MQAWLAAQGQAVDVVVGVASKTGEVAAHAWVDEGCPPPDAAAFRELVRIPAPTPPSRG